MLQANARSCQSTPLIDSCGRLVGIMSTHSGRKQMPDQLALLRLDSITGQAALVIDGARRSDKTPEVGLFTLL